jgi:hypothetical protein
MATQLKRPPTYVTVRTGTGAVAADSATLSDANYPLASAIEPPGAPEVEFYWYAGGGTVDPNDFLDLQLLHRDVKYGASGLWVEGPTRYGVRAGELCRFKTGTSTQIYLRVQRVVCPAGTGLVIKGASSAFTS